MRKKKIVLRLTELETVTVFHALSYICDSAIKRLSGWSLDDPEVRKELSAMKRVIEKIGLLFSFGGTMKDDDLKQRVERLESRVRQLEVSTYRRIRHWILNKFCKYKLLYQVWVIKRIERRDERKAQKKP